MTTTTTLPHNLDAERAVLGAILLDGRRWTEAIDVLTPTAFYRDAHQTLFDAMMSLGQRGVTIDPLTLSQALGTRLDSVGGLSYITRLTDGVPRGGIVHHASIVLRHAQARALIAVARDLEAGAMDPDADPEVVQEAAETALKAVQSQGDGNQFIAPAIAAERMMTRIETWQEGTTLAGVTTGFRSLNDSLLGMHRTELIVLAGRPGMGKSALAGQIAAAVAIDAHLPVAYFTLEMEAEEVLIRMACARTSIAYRDLMRGRANASELWHLQEQQRAIHDSALHINDAHDLTVAQVRRNCRLLHAKHPLGLIVIDYLTLMSGVTGERHDTRSREVGSWAKRLKGLAKELRVPVLLCAQLNRQVEQGAGNARPKLKDLRDSGEIEQAANVVMFVHHNPEDGPVRASSVIVAKQRHGPVGDVPMTFNGPMVRFEEH